MLTPAGLDLSVVIVSWNTCSYLEKCLVALRNNSAGLGVQVVVVDNASTDGSAGLVRERFPEVLLLQASCNLGFARANNLGEKHAASDVLLFLNPDTEVTGDALGKMLSYLQSQESVGAVGAHLLNSDMSFQESCVQAFPTIWNQLLDSDLLRRWFPQSKLWGVHTGRSEESEAVNVDAVSGACLMMKRSVFEAIGGFDEHYFMYSDDLDLCYRTWKAGYSVQYMNGCEVIHHKGQSSLQQNQEFEALQQRESMTQFFRSQRGRSYSVAYKAGMAIIAGCRAVVLIGMMACGKKLVQGRAIGSALEKWFAVLRWSLSLQGYRAEPGTN
jgi:GT2 family glycosyltransferase